MNNETNEFSELESAPMSPFVPLVLISVSLLAFVIFQISMTLPQRAAIQSAIQSNENAVSQSEQLQQVCNKLFNELWATNDNDVKAIFEKNGIKVVPPAGAAPATGK